MATTKRRASDIEARLVEWGREYGGGKYEYESGGSSPLASLMKWHGRPPTGLGFSSDNLAADEVEDAVNALLKQPTGWIPGNVIRCEYLTPGKPVFSKLQELRALGIGLQRVGYYQKLREARIHVAAWLRIPMSEGVDTAEDGIDSRA
ncbi:MAG: hypothetical protein WAM90_15725 [Rhodanobacter sp.]